MRLVPSAAFHQVGQADKLKADIIQVGAEDNQLTVVDNQLTVVESELTDEEIQPIEVVCQLIKSTISFHLVEVNKSHSLTWDIAANTVQNIHIEIRNTNEIVNQDLISFISCLFIIK